MSEAGQDYYYPVLVVVQPREDVTGEGVPPEVPDPDAMCSRLSDVLGDVTKHDGRLGWRVVRLTSMLSPLPPPAASPPPPERTPEQEAAFSAGYTDGWRGRPSGEALRSPALRRFYGQGHAAGTLARTGSPR